MISASRRFLFIFYVSSHVKRPLFQCRLWPGYFLKLWLVASGLLSLSARGSISESGFQPGAIRSVRLSFFILIALSLFRVRFRVRFVFIPFLPLPYLTSPLFSFFLFVLKPNSKLPSPWRPTGGANCPCKIYVFWGSRNGSSKPRVIMRTAARYT